jgi:2-succinyl-5-enolpyruvyl-6-hydroxy-3-cyclohexene-1-carboxylate synthase
MLTQNCTLHSPLVPSSRTASGRGFGPPPKQQQQQQQQIQKPLLKQQQQQQPQPQPLPQESLRDTIITSEDFPEHRVLVEALARTSCYPSLAAWLRANQQSTIRNPSLAVLALLRAVDLTGTLNELNSLEEEQVVRVYLKGGRIFISRIFISAC